MLLPLSLIGKTIWDGNHLAGCGTFSEAGGGAQCPNFNSLTLVSLSAAVMSLAYSTIGFGASIDAGLHYTDRSKIDYTLNREPRFSGIFGVFNALGTARHR